MKWNDKKGVTLVSVVCADCLSCTENVEAEGSSCFLLN
jgi:hypothetical protein